MNPLATFDCLAIGIKLQSMLSNFSLSEVSLFSYLSCLLSLYRKNPVSDWGYKFAGTQFGSPYSVDIEHSMSTLEIAGLVHKENGYYQIIDKGLDMYSALQKLHQNSIRDEFIEGACSSVLTLPLSTIKLALVREPELNISSKLKQTRFLLENGPGLETLYNDFSILSQTIGINVKDMMVPAVIWLNYLSSVE